MQTSVTFGVDHFMALSCNNYPYTLAYGAFRINKTLVAYVLRVQTPPRSTCRIGFCRNRLLI
jgi:hypothetical protein